MTSDPSDVIARAERIADIGHDVGRIHHVQLAIPPGGEDEARRFWSGLLGFVEIDKPPKLATRGGCWFRAGDAEIHLGIEDPFRPNAKAHPALEVATLGPLLARLRSAGIDIAADDGFPGYERFYCHDPFGNRLEFLAPLPEPSTRGAPRAVGAAFVRPASSEDVPAIRAILAAHENDGPIVTGDVVGPYVRHLIAHHVALVAELDGAVVGYAASVDAGIAIHLADLFVRPALLGRGIGRRLLAAAFDDPPRRTTFASDDPRALPLYVRAGMAALWPNLCLEGDARRLIPRDPAASVEAATAETLAALEREWTGVDRLVDHQLWASQPAADPFVVTEAGEPVAIGHARFRQTRELRVLGRLLVRPHAAPLPATLAAIDHAAAGRGEVAVSVPGPHPALPVLLEAGFRIVDRDTFMASDPALVEPTRLLADGGML